MDIPTDIPVVNPEDFANLHPLEALQQLHAASMPSAPSVPQVPNAPAASSSEGNGWRGLLQMLAPVIGGLAMGGGAKQTGFLNGYSEGQQIVNEDRQRTANEAQKRAGIAATYIQKIADQADQITDPVQFAHFVDTADMGFSKSGLGKPGEIKSQIAFNSQNVARKTLKELSDQVDYFARNNLTPDDLAQSGAVLHTSDGQAFPAALVVDLLHPRPTVDGKPMPMPKKQDVAATTDYGRYLAKYAKENGTTVDTLTTAQEDAARVQYASDKPKAAEKTFAPGGVDSQFNDLVELWKAGHPGKEVPADVRVRLRKQANEVNDRPQAMGDRPQAMGAMLAMSNETDPKAIAAAIIRGDRDPDTSRLGRGAVGAVETELAKAGYHQAAAITDWKATQRYMASRNATPQLKLNQSINALPELLDSVDALASKWKGGRFPILNSANLALAKGGAYGSEVASVARQLDTQIADVVGDLGTVYMGGNSPTDHAIQLAKTALSGEWDQKVLHDMVRLAKGNVIIRRNSINNTGVQGASLINPYAPQAPETPDAGKTYKLVGGKWVPQ
jgi:hypothetical protein